MDYPLSEIPRVDLEQKTDEDNCGLAYKGFPRRCIFQRLSPRRFFFIASMFAPSGSRPSRPRRCKKLRALPSQGLLEDEDACASESDYEVDDPKDPNYLPLVSQTATPNVRIVKNQRRDPGLKARANAVAEPSDTSVLTGNTNTFGRVQAAHGVARNLSYRRPDLVCPIRYL